MKNANADRKIRPSQCPNCGSKSKHIGRRRQSTSYIDDNSNFTISCRPCYRELEDRWKEQWKEYWYSQGVIP